MARFVGTNSETPEVRLPLLPAFQASTYDPDSDYRWMGSIAMDKDHNMALGYSKSSLSTKPGIYINGRLGTDAPNTLGSEATVQAGIGVQTAGAGKPLG